MRIAGAHAYTCSHGGGGGESLDPVSLLQSCQQYMHTTLKCDRENYELLKYLKNVYCVMTNQYPILYRFSCTRFLPVSLDLPTPRLLTVHLPPNVILSEILPTVYIPICVQHKKDKF